MLVQHICVFWLSCGHNDITLAPMVESKCWQTFCVSFPFIINIGGKGKFGTYFFIKYPLKYFEFIASQRESYKMEKHHQIIKSCTFYTIQ